MQHPIFVVTCQRIRKRKAYYVSFPLNDQLLNRIKSLERESRKWNPTLKVWELTTKALYNIIKIYKKSNKIYFDFGDRKEDFITQIKKIDIIDKENFVLLANLEKKKKKWLEWKNELEKNYLNYSDQLHKHLKKDVKLYPHQIVAGMYLNEVKSGLISHDMGIGKTLSSIAFVEMKQFEKAFVVTPNSLKFNYYDEVLKFTDSKVHVVNWGKKNNKYTIAESKYIIVNYDFFNTANKKAFLVKWKKLGINVIDTVICDESHRLKNTKSNTYKNFKRTFSKKIFRDGNISKVFLSGTPAPNRAYELYTILNQISPLDFQTKTYFNEYYCGMRYDTEEGEYVVDNANMKLEELYHKIAPYSHRKKKEEVFPDLPEKIYQKMMLELSPKEQSVYNDIEESIANEFVANPSANPLTIMIRLRQYTAFLKIKYISEIIDNVIESGDKMVIVDFFKESLLQLNEKFSNIAGLHTGDQSVEERANIVRTFQDLDSFMKIFLGSIQTCNYGLTLTAANKIIITTLPYSVGEYDQVADRLHRIGQDKTVNIYLPIFRNTVDEYVYSAILNKREEIVKVMDNEDYSANVNESIFSEIVERIKEKYG